MVLCLPKRRPRR